MKIFYMVKLALLLTSLQKLANFTLQKCLLRTIFYKTVIASNLDFCLKGSEYTKLYCPYCAKRKY